MAKKGQPVEVTLGHSDENDGIDELDNKLPNWWVALFLVTIVVAVFVFIDWHVAQDKSLAGLYDEEVAAALATYGAPPEAPREVPLTPEAIGAGQATFATICSACHGADASGGVGPNLRDAIWLYGSQPGDIANTVFYGTDNGMPIWGPTLGPTGVAQVAAYVHSLGQGQ